MEYAENDWHYCDGTDRRFYSEVCNGIKPAGRSQLTDKEPARDIPLGWYNLVQIQLNKETLAMTYNINTTCNILTIGKTFFAAFIGFLSNLKSGYHTDFHYFTFL